MPKEFQGIGASPGTANGTVRLITTVSPKDMKVSPGDIVVANHLTPEQTVHFKQAGGFLADVGGKTSHAAVVAREWSIPAVVGVLSKSGVRPTEVLKEGQFISINGTTGMVEVISTAGVIKTENEKERDRLASVIGLKSIRLSPAFLDKLDCEARFRLKYLREGD